MVQDPALPTQDQAPAANPTDNVNPDVMGPQEAVSTEQIAPQTHASPPPLELTVSIKGLDIWKKPIDEALLLTLAQLRHTHGVITDEAVNSYLVWLINSDLATIIRDVATKRRG